jgi:D-tagatose-1,6-bisphosphate aldolase subunit GatZ/KbaZ
MQSSPADWNKYYRGSPAEINYKLSYSFSDRCRYYLPFPAVRAAQARLISNLEKTGVPLALLSQFLPRQYTRVRTGELENKPTALLKDRVRDCIEDYAFAEGR